MAPSLPELLGDRDRLIQAMLNLVRNALEAGANEVRLRSRAEYGVALAAVADDGHGLALDEGQVTVFVVEHFHGFLLE